MKRTLLVLSCSACLAAFLSAIVQAGPGDLTDLDGVPDPVDNCTLDPNGPLLGDCSAQEDGDGDGFGNACDTDTDNDGATGLPDVFDTLAESKVGGTLLNYDFDCDGATGLPDVFKALADSKIGKIPGPSCGHPAGTPCP